MSPTGQKQRQRQVVVSEYLPMPFIDRLSEKCEVVYDPDLYGDHTRLLQAVSEADAIVIRNRTVIDQALLAAAKRLRVVGRLGVGLDNIDLKACSAAGVHVIPAIGANAVSVAEYVIGAALVLMRGVFGMTPSMLRGEWPRQGHAFGRELAGKTLGLIGFGSIANEVAIRAGALGMVIVAHDPHVRADHPSWQAARRVELARLLTVSDVVSLHVSLTAETRNLIDESAIARMSPSTVLINTSRGGVVDESALAAALREGRLGGAAIDVFQEEPLRTESASTFAGIDNLLLTPHVAGNTAESAARVAHVTVEAVLDALMRAL